MSQRGQLQVNTFTKGLITEASPLSFPREAALDIINMHLKRNGTMERRLGMDFEDDYALNDTGLSSNVLAGARVTAYRWSIPNGNIEEDIGVIQIGNQIWFLDLFTANPSANILNGGNPVVATGLSNDVIMTFTTLNNYLIGVANQLPQPYLFTYDSGTDTVTIETSAILVRDMWGVDDSLAVDGRPTTLSPEHHYNLLNQGWLPDVESTCGVGVNAIDCTFNTFGIYPSNSDVWTYGRIEDLTSADVKKFDPVLAGRNLVNNGQVARGHFILGLYNRGQSRSIQTGLTLPVDREEGRVTAIASYAGRVFYAGILSRIIDGDNRSPNLSGTILFSQLFENKLNLVKCYQEADPTSPDINDIIDTDGGLIQIPECSYIYALRPTKESLFVFAANGVWEIRGDEGGFRATSFQINKISNVGVYAPKSIVEVNNSFFFWADSGIYTLVKNQEGFWNTENITLNTIQRFYNALPDPSKKNARGYHDLHTNTARWLYYSSESHTIGDPIDINPPIPTGDPVLVEGTTSSLTNIIYFDIIGYSSDRVLTVQCNNTSVSTVRSNILDLTGLAITSINNNVSYAAEPSIMKTTSGSDISMVKLNSGALLSIWATNESNQRISCAAATLSGTTYSPGTVVYPYTSINSNGITFRTVELSANKVLCVFYDASRINTTSLRAFVATISGTAVTTGAVFTITATSAIHHNIARIDDNTVLLMWEDGSLGRCSKTLSVTGTTITESATHQILNFTSETMLTPVIHLQTPTSGFLHYLGETKPRVRKFSLSGHQVTVDSYLQLTTNTLRSPVVGDLSSALISEHNILVSLYVLDSTSVPYMNIAYVYGASSNTTITPFYDFAISGFTVANENESLRIADLGDSKYMIGFRTSSNTLHYKTYSIIK